MLFHRCSFFTELLASCASHFVAPLRLVLPSPAGEGSFSLILMDVAVCSQRSMANFLFPVNVRKFSFLQVTIWLFLLQRKSGKTLGLKGELADCRSHRTASSSLWLLH